MLDDWKDCAQTSSFRQIWIESSHISHFNNFAVYLQVHYGCNPSQLVLTDPSVCSLYDIRNHKVSLDLFEIPSNKLLHQEERLVMSSPGRESLHHILSHHTLLTIDERFAKYPVLYQVIPCVSWPALMSCQSLSSTRDVMAIGCPTNQEVFSLITESGCEVMCSTPLWKVSQVWKSLKP